MSRKKRRKKRQQKSEKYIRHLARENYHHLLFQRKHWQQGYAKILREHSYCGGYIPQATLHREIHSKAHDVPTPNGSDCRYAITKLNEMLEQGIIDINDRLDRKAQILSSIFSERCPATSAMLLWQSEIISKFYGRQ